MLSQIYHVQWNIQLKLKMVNTHGINETQI